MAGTRNKNTYCDYLLEQKDKESIHKYLFYENSSRGKAFDNNVNIPSIGYIPSHLPADILSNNSVDIESRLFGIGSCNLVVPQKSLTPDINKIYTKDFFDYNRMVQIPPHLTIRTDQRPNIP